MSFESEDQKVAAIEHGVSTAFWQNYLLPMLQERAKGHMESLALQPSPNDDIKRGWIQALRWVIALPAQDVAIHRREAEDRIADAKIVEAEKYRAEVGYRSPYPQEPGDLKPADGPTPTA